ncbi:MAG: hypothetical protein ACKVJK_11950 [Methylophagaceae bacterium]
MVEKHIIQPVVVVEHHKTDKVVLQNQKERKRLAEGEGNDLKEEVVLAEVMVVPVEEQLDKQDLPVEAEVPLVAEEELLAQEVQLQVKITEQLLQEDL